MRATPVTIPRMMSTCSRLSRTLNAELCDEIELLRAARVLHRLQGSIHLGLVGTLRVGWHPSQATIQATLDDMECELRRVLLDYPQIRAQDIRLCLLRSLTLCNEALDLLAAIPDPLDALPDTSAPSATATSAGCALV